jgi:hypothetical protein
MSTGSILFLMTQWAQIRNPGAGSLVLSASAASARLSWDAHVLQGKVSQVDPQDTQNEGK